jgi:hypothetical protein
VTDDVPMRLDDARGELGTAAKELPKVFTDEEFMTLVSAIHLRPGPDCSDGEFTRYMEWAHRVRSEGLLLERLLREEVLFAGFEGEEAQLVNRARTDTQGTVVRAEHRFTGGSS